MKNITTTIVLVVLLAFNSTLKAQNIQLPDNNFKNYLKLNHPSLLGENDSLVISNAESLTGALDLGSQNIIDFSGIEHFISISELNLENNSIINLPEICTLSNLKILNLNNTSLSQSPEIVCLSNLEEINFDNNELVASPDLSGLTNLTTVSLVNCGLKDVPDGIKALPNLSSVNVSLNKFTLNDLLEFNEISNFSNIFIAMPQRQFVLTSEYIVDSASTVILHTDNDKDIEGVSYSLVKDGIEIISLSDSGGFHITNVSSSDTGVYNIRIYTTQLSNIFLESNDIAIKLNEEETLPLCGDEVQFLYSLTPKTCSTLAEVTFEVLGTESVSFDLLLDENSYESNSEGIFTQLDNGIYTAFSTTENCISDTLLFEVIDLGCTDLLMPSKGLYSVPIQHQGKVSVYNKSGQLMGSFNGPIDWNGEIDNELLPSGYFYLLSEDESASYTITIIR